MPRPRLPAVEIGLFALVGTLWGSSYLAVKLAGTGIGPITFVAIRLGFAVAFLVAVGIVLRVPLPAPRDVPRIAVAGLTGVVVPFTLITWGQRDIDSGLASIFNAATPLLTVLLAAVVLRDEPLRLGRLAGIVLGLGGVAVVVGGGVDAGSDALAMLAILAASGSYALHAVYGRRVLGDVQPMTIVLVQSITGAVVATALAIAIERPALALPPAEVLGAAAWLGVASSGVGALAFFRLLASWGAGRTALVNYLIPVVGVLAGAVVLGERLDVTVLVGGALVVAGVAVAGRPGGVTLHRPTFAPRAVAVGAPAIEPSPA
jgi:drug/metabolite transporter (DMT)-like permease